METFYGIDWFTNRRIGCAKCVNMDIILFVSPCQYLWIFLHVTQWVVNMCDGLFAYTEKDIIYSRAVNLIITGQLTWHIAIAGCATSIRCTPLFGFYYSGPPLLEVVGKCECVFNVCFCCSTYGKVLLFTFCYYRGGITSTQERHRRRRQLI